MIIWIISAFFTGGAVMFFAIVACAVSKQADERAEKISPYSEGVGAKDCTCPSADS